MFKKRKAPFGQNRFSKRNKDFDFREEDGYSASESDAGSHTGISESHKFQLYIGTLLRSVGKIYHELLPGTDRRSGFVGTEDNQSESVADKKAIKSVIICMCAVSAAFFAMSSGLNKSDKVISEIRRKDSDAEYLLRAEFFYENEYYAADAEISVKPESYPQKNTELIEEYDEDWLENFASDLIDRLSNNTSGASLLLPQETEGVRINWILPKEDEPTWLFAFGLFISLYLWFSRYDGIKRRQKADRAALEYEIPNMSRQIVLLLNAGLICDAAFTQLNEQSADNKNPLYREMRKLHEKSLSDNSSFSANLYSFALDYGNRDLIRFATLVYEHSGRGSELASKLEAEANLQYESRLAMAKARAKEAETKLCFPLMLLLVALVIICIAPAMAEV